MSCKYVWERDRDTYIERKKDTWIEKKGRERDCKIFSWKYVWEGDRDTYLYREKGRYIHEEIEWERLRESERKLER